MPFHISSRSSFGGIKGTRRTRVVIRSPDNSPDWLRTSLMANSPIRKAVRPMPELSCHWPNINRFTPVTWSIPTEPIAMPKNNPIPPLAPLELTMESTTQILKKISAKYSQCPNFNVTLDSCGAMVARTIAENVPPIKEANTPRDSAASGLPRLTMG